jgi:hypothetical protein
MSALRTLRVGADTPDWCIPRLGSCAASRFTADGCRLCCSTPELSAIPKFRFAWSAFSDNRIELRHLWVIRAVKSEDPISPLWSYGALFATLFYLPLNLIQAYRVRYRWGYGPRDDQESEFGHSQRRSGWVTRRFA